MRSRRIWLALAVPVALAALTLASSGWPGTDGPAASVYNDNLPVRLGGSTILPVGQPALPDQHATLAQPALPNQDPAWPT